MGATQRWSSERRGRPGRSTRSEDPMAGRVRQFPDRLDPLRLFELPPKTHPRKHPPAPFHPTMGPLNPHVHPTMGPLDPHVHPTMGPLDPHVHPTMGPLDPHVHP